MLYGFWHVLGEIHAFSEKIWQKINLLSISVVEISFVLGFLVKRQKSLFTFQVFFFFTILANSCYIYSQNGVYWQTKRHCTAEWLGVPKALLFFAKQCSPFIVVHPYNGERLG